VLEDADVELVRSVARRELPPHPKLRHVVAEPGTVAAARALEGAEVVVHLGFALWRSPDAAAANAALTRTVVAARPARVVLASSAAVYGAWPDNPLPLGEDRQPRPNPECPYALQKLAAERLLSEAVPTAVLRLSAVLGPHADPRVRRSAAGYRLVVPAISGVRQAVQFLDEDEAALAVLSAAKAGFTGVVNVAPPDWLSEHGLAAVAGGRVVRLPRRVLLGAAEAARALRLLPFGADRAVLLGGPLALDPARARAALGFCATRSSAEVLRSALPRGAPRGGADEAAAFRPAGGAAGADRGEEGACGDRAEGEVGAR
jgi:nucleoside-diphosphate-sugar epimerase